jgi:hypothetical protein
MQVATELKSRDGTNIFITYVSPDGPKIKSLRMGIPCLFPLQALSAKKS